MLAARIKQKFVRNYKCHFEGFDGKKSRINGYFFIFDPISTYWDKNHPVFTPAITKIRVMNLI